MLRHPLFTVPLFAGLAAADVVACFGMFWLHGWGESPWGAALFHGLAALPAALLGAAALTEATKSTRGTLLVFFLVLTLTIPVIGILITAALALILRQPSRGGLRPGERFVFGNPEATAARRESPRPPLEPMPLAARFRDMDEDTLCRAILGLKHLRPIRAAAPFLRRFQQDPRTSVQFSAQAVLTGATETLEETLRTLRARASAHPGDPETTLALAATLDELADWTPPGDTTAALYRQDATTLLLSLQNHPALQHRVQPLLARQRLAPGAGPAQAAAAAVSLVQGGAEARAFWTEAAPADS